MVLERNANKSRKQLYIHVLNKFLHVVQRTPTGLGFQVIFLKENLCSCEPAYYTVNVKIGMMEDSDIYKIGIISPFLGAVEDRFCGIDNVDATVALYGYIYIFYTVFCLQECGLVYRRND